MLKPILAAVVALGATSALAAGHAQNRIDGQRPDAPELAAPGDLKVGVRTLEMVNPGQIDMMAVSAAEPLPDPVPTYDRPLTVEVWYPAAADASGETTYQAVIRDGATTVTLHGSAMRDAAAADGSWPLVILSHGYPGNRYIMSHLGENLASKGYVVASIDHTDSIYEHASSFSPVSFGSTLVNRSFDQLFVLDQMAAMSAGEGFLSGRVDADNTAIIGYSMGGYGAIITVGGGVTQNAVDLPFGAPHGLLGAHKAGSETHAALPDDRVKTAIAIGPWGLNFGLWDGEGLSGVKVPMLFMAGSVDDVSGYENGVRGIWQAATGVDRSLLTFENANHNAAAPYPAPQEGREVSPALGFAPYDHYADAVWDTVKMNNIAQHFATAWLDMHLKGDAAKGEFLDLIPKANDGVVALEDDGSEKPEHTHWRGFAPRTAKGLRFETLAAGE
ncbi:MAG: dienelactone hydrolase [Pseudomonadota bacterium]